MACPLVTNKQIKKATRYKKQYITIAPTSMLIPECTPLNSLFLKYQKNPPQIIAAIISVIFSTKLNIIFTILLFY